MLISIMSKFQFALYDFTNSNNNELNFYMGKHANIVSVQLHRLYYIHCGSKKTRQLWRTITTTQFSRF